MLPEQQRQAELFAEVRAWDMCAMHDVDAAARITGYAPDELLPRSDPDSCLLVLQETGRSSTWELELDVFQVVPTPDGTPIEAGGAVLQQVRTSDDMRCAYSLPIGPEGEEPWGIELSAVSLDADEARCDVAREYATAIAPRMIDPPLRSAGLTSPGLGLTSSDPCALSASMVPFLAEDAALAAEDVEVSDLRPFECSIIATVGEGDRARQVRGSVTVTVEPHSEIGGSTVTGFPAARNRIGNACEVVFAPSDVVLTGNPGSQPSVPAVQVVGDCERVDELAVAVAGAVPPAPGGALRDDALALGDLNPPPTAAAAGAPFDPCTVVGWQDYPAAVQPPTRREPVPMPVGPQDPFAVGCTFNAGDMFSSLVWGMPRDVFSADPAARRKATPAQFAGRPGAEERSTNEITGNPTCYSAVQLDHGIAAMSTGLPGDPCAVNRAVLEQVVQRVS